MLVAILVMMHSLCFVLPYHVDFETAMLFRMFANREGVFRRYVMSDVGHKQKWSPLSKE